jgi:Na+-driven multidrug efflux pump
MPSLKSPVQSLDLLNDPVRRVLFKMTWPMMMGIVSLMLFNLADIYFVGQLGTEPMAALAFTFSVFCLDPMMKKGKLCSLQM